jgi:hypothetical protein
MWKRLFAHTLTVGLAGAAPPAMAQVAVVIPQICEAHADLAEALGARYDETSLGLGLQSAEQLVEIWRSTETGSWTILVVKPDGIACIIGSGTNWFDELAEVEGSGA